MRTAIGVNGRVVLGYEGHCSRKARTRLIGAFSEKFRNGRLAGIAVLGYAIAVVWYKLI